MTVNSSIDFIGDIHGHFDELIYLFQKLGYSNSNGYYSHPTRKAFFVGDFIDRGPKVGQVLKVVRAMIENGAAYTVLGNHEYNSICYWARDNEGTFLREHSEKNTDQHLNTINSMSSDDLLDYVAWFKTVPIYFECES